MGYTVHLFAHEAATFAERLRHQPEAILERTRARVAREGELGPEDLEYGLSLAEAICRGDLPPVCSEDHFWALCWLADTELERIPLNVLVSVKRFAYIEEIGLWPLLGRWSPPFPVPRAESVPPGVGFLPHDRIRPEALPCLANLSGNDENVRYARQQFMEVLESLDEDRLDLLAICI